MKNWYKKLNSKKSIVWYLIFALIIFMAGANMAMAEWQEPDAPPTVEDFYAPLTTTSEPQAKAGYLLIDPVDYKPSESSVINYPVNKPLIVTGGGAKFSTNNVYNDILIVDTDTLYADAFQEWVGIGISSVIGNEKMSIYGQTFQIGTETNPINGRALSSYSNDNYGIYVDANATSLAGIYGVNTNNTSRAIYGESQGKNVGVLGESADGKGIYASTDSTTYGAVYGNNDSTGFAGYFDGRVNAVSDLVADVFLPTGLQRSLVPFVSGEEAATYAVPGIGNITFDGTYIWLATSPVNSNNLFKIRASDGKLIKSWDRFFTEMWNTQAITFDGKYVWWLDNQSDITRFDPVTETLTSLSLDNLFGANQTTTESIVATTINGESYIWIPDGDWFSHEGEIVVRVKASDMTYDSYNITNGGTCSDGQYRTEADCTVNSGIWTTFTVQGDPGNLGNFMNITYDGEYIWVGSYDSHHVVKLWAENPADSDYPAEAVDTWTDDFHCAARGIFYDGYYIWCLQGQGQSQQSVRIWAEDPYDPHHPQIAVGDVMDFSKGIATDGTFVWITNHVSTTQGLYRYLSADPTQWEKVDDSVRSGDIIFDGTYLWVMDDDTPLLHKYYSGTGMGHTNLGSIVQLKNVNGYCSVTTTQQCLYDWQCPTAETCDTGYTAQSGSTYIGGNAEIKKDHCYSSDTGHHYDRACTVDADCSDLTNGQCVGGDIKVDDDVQVSQNHWGGICEDGTTYCTYNSDCAVACYGAEYSVVGSCDDATACSSDTDCAGIGSGICNNLSASCDEGDFMGGVELDANSEISKIYCWEL